MSQTLKTLAVTVAFVAGVASGALAQQAQGQPQNGAVPATNAAGAPPALGLPPAGPVATNFVFAIAPLVAAGAVVAAAGAGGTTGTTSTTSTTNP